MSIAFKHTIIHVLDLDMGMPLLSTDLLTLNDETESFKVENEMILIEKCSKF